MRYLILIALLAPLPLLAQQNPAPHELARRLKNVLLERHIEPRLIDDEFSREVFDAFIKTLDQDHLYFTEVEISQLRSYRDRIDDQVNLDRWDFLPMVVASYREKLERAEKIVYQICSAPVDLRINERLPSDAFARDIPDLTRRWSIVITREVMQQLAVGRHQYADLTDEKYFAVNESSARDRVKRINVRRIRRILSHPAGFEAYLTTLFLKDFAGAFDPHSDYMSTTEIENFISALSSNGYNFGVEFQEDEKGELVVGGLLPGGPAWNSGEINTGDVLEKVRWVGQEWIETAGMTEHELEELFTEFNHASIELSLRKQGGFVRSVLLRKEKINQEDAVVRAFVLHGKKKVGYISLPDFYSNWGGRESSQSAGDVAREIVKLKKENIEGLILDVRFNGGGSLGESVAMTGIFIDGGPVGIERERGKEPETIKDSNRGTVYDGPLIILVNGLSASASEFLAAALQDYRRAIIVGGPTYGKGVGQEIFSLQPGTSVFHASPSTQAWGYATVTTTRMYRIDGKSVQSRGVRPDIELPDLIDLFNFREAILPGSLRPDSVIKKTYPKLFSPLPIASLRLRSRSRVSQNEAFEAVNRYKGAIQAYMITKPGSINWQTLMHRAANLQCEFANIERKLSETTKAYQAQVPRFSEDRLKLDQYAENLNKGWIGNLSHDFALEEAYYIVCDYIDILDQP